MTFGTTLVVISTIYSAVIFVYCHIYLPDNVAAFALQEPTNYNPNADWEEVWGYEDTPVDRPRSAFHFQTGLGNGRTASVVLTL